MVKTYQWRIQNLSDAGIPIWAPKLGAQIKGELMQNYISHLISSTQMGLHILRHLKCWIKDLVYYWVCSSSLFKCMTLYRLYKRIQKSRYTGVPKRSHMHQCILKMINIVKHLTSGEIQFSYTYNECFIVLLRSTLN